MGMSNNVYNIQGSGEKGKEQTGWIFWVPCTTWNQCLIFTYHCCVKIGGIVTTHSVLSCTSTQLRQLLQQSLALILFCSSTTLRTNTHPSKGASHRYWRFFNTNSLWFRRWVYGALFVKVAKRQNAFPLFRPSVRAPHSDIQGAASRGRTYYSAYHCIAGPIDSKGSSIHCQFHRLLEHFEGQPTDVHRGCLQIIPDRQVQALSAGNKSEPRASVRRSHSQAKQPNPSMGTLPAKILDVQHHKIFRLGLRGS